MARIKRTCSGCKALELDGRCDLGHRTMSSGRWPFVRYRPAEPCEKPLTIKAYIAIWRKSRARHK